jgi:pyridoxine/pyridoxamine 5'-phosphate oxidase
MLDLINSFTDYYLRGGYLFIPNEFEFWQGDANNLDDRIRFRRPLKDEDLSNPIITVGENNWIIERLAP